MERYAPLARQRLLDSELGRLMPDAAIDSVLREGVLRRHPAGRVVIMQGTPVADLVLVVDGQLEISTDGQDGRRSICWILAPGEWFNMIPAIDGGPMIHTARTHSESVLLHLPQAGFLRLLDSDPALPMLFLRVLAGRSRRLYERLAAESLSDLRGRLCLLLVLLAEQHGHDTGQGIELRVQLSQAELAAMLGTTRQSLNRELKALADERLIALSYSHLTLCKPDALRARVPRV